MFFSFYFFFHSLVSFWYNGLSQWICTWRSTIYCPPFITRDFMDYKFDLLNPCSIWKNHCADGFKFHGVQKNSIVAIRSKYSINIRIVSYIEAGSKWMDINIATIFKVSVFKTVNSINQVCMYVYSRDSQRTQKLKKQYSTQ